MNQPKAGRSIRFRRLFGIASTLAALIPLTMATSARAQPADPDPSTARIHFGPLYLSPSLQLRELGIDTNVFNSTEDPKSDFTATVAPQIQALMAITRRLVIRGTGSAGLTYYATYANQRSLNGSYDVRADLNLRRLTFFAMDGLTNTRDRPSYEIDIRPRHTEHSTRAGINFKLHDKFSFDLSGRESQLRYDPTADVGGTNLAESLDGNSRTLAADVRFRLTPYTTISLRGDSTHDRFTGNQIRNTNSVGIEPGVTFSPRALISGTATVGFRRFEALDPAVPNYSGLTASAGLSYRLNGATLVNTTWNRGLSYSYEPLGPYYIQNNVSVNIRRQLVSRFDATAGVLHAVYDYKSVIAPAISLASGDREDKTISYSFDVGYRASRRARIGFGVESWHRSSNQRSDRTYTGFRFRSTATVAF